MDKQPSKGSGQTNQTSSQAQAAHELDPVCGMDVDGSSSNTERVQRHGTTYYFCSSDCRKQFESAPEDLGA